MHKVVFDSTVLVSASLAKTGVSAELLHKAKDGGFDMCLAEEILEEVPSMEGKFLFPHLTENVWLRGYFLTKWERKE